MSSNLKHLNEMPRVGGTSAHFLIRVVVSVLLGVAVGVFFGPSTVILQPIGKTYVMLLQSVVYPYITCSLISDLGKLSPALSAKLFKRGGIIYAMLIALLVLVAFILGKAMPTPDTHSVHGYSIGSIAHGSLLLLLVPENILVSMANNYVPAVIVFCVIFGLTLQQINSKNTILDLLDTVSHVCLKFWSFVVRFAPIGVFALIADVAGTLRLTQLFDLGEYFLIYTVAVVVLSFWILPGLMSTLTGIRYRTILEEMASALIFSMATTLSVVSLPLIQQSVEKVLKKRLGEIKEDTRNIIGSTLVISYPFAQAGGILIYLYIIFCTLYFNTPLSLGEQILLPIVNYFATIGASASVINSLNFLTQWLNLPETSVDLYIGMNSITKYGQIIASVMGYAFMAFIVTYNCHRLLTFSWKKFTVFFLVPITAIILFSVLVHDMITDPDTLMAKRLDNFSLQETLKQKVHASILKPGETSQENKIDSLYLIQKTGVIRVGFNPNNKPFVYYNDKNELVGFDIEMIYNLAKDLGVKIEFVPFEWDSLTSDMVSGKFDIAISAVYVSDIRLTQVAFTTPYFRSPIALVAPSEKITQFKTAASINKIDPLNIGTFHDPILISLIHSNFPKANLVLFDKFDAEIAKLFSEQKIDAAIWTEEQIKVWTLSYPGYRFVVPEHMAAPVLIAYMVGQHSPEFLTFLNYWIALQKENGLLDKLHKHWIEIQPEESEAPRWSIYHNVLGF